MDWVVVGLLGALVGIADIIGRYRDAPWRSLTSLSALLYVGINVAASIFALVLIHAFNWNFGLTGDAARWTQVLAAGVGAMAILRSSFYSVRIGEEDVQVGPGNLLKIILDTADRDVDRVRARQRAAIINNVLRDVAFDRAYMALPAYCFALVQNLSDEDQREAAEEIAALAVAAMPDEVRVRLLGLTLMNVVGEGVLREAVASLGGEIRGAAGPAPAPLVGAPPLEP